MPAVPKLLGAVTALLHREGPHLCAGGACISCSRGSAAALKALCCPGEMQTQEQSSKEEGALRPSSSLGKRNHYTSTGASPQASSQV